MNKETYICKDCDKCPFDSEKLPYTRLVTSAIIQLGKAIEIILNLGDKPALEEMQRLCNETFEQAFRALNEESGNIH